MKLYAHCMIRLHRQGTIDVVCCVGQDLQRNTCTTLQVLTYYVVGHIGIILCHMFDLRHCRSARIKMHLLGRAPSLRQNHFFLKKYNFFLKQKLGFRVQGIGFRGRFEGFFFFGFGFQKSVVNILEFFGLDVPSLSQFCSASWPRAGRALPGRGGHSDQALPGASQQS